MDVSENRNRLPLPEVEPQTVVSVPTELSLLCLLCSDSHSVDLKAKRRRI